jgi:hypothetical protein
MTSRVIGRMGALAVALVLGAGMLTSSPAGAAPGGFYGPARLLNTTRVVGFPQHFVLTAQQAAGRGGNPPPGGGFGGFPGNGGGGTSAPRITGQPSSTSVSAGTAASFSAAASGTPTPTVQWDQSTNGGATFSPIGGATSTTYSFTTTTGENGYRYEAVFTNSAGHATTNSATLTVTAVPQTAPSITLNPTSQSISAGTAVSFSAAASGSPTPTVQWDQSTNGGSTFSPIGGATSTTYSFTTTTGENGYLYEAVFTNSNGHATTSAATLTVTAAVAPAPAPQQSSNWSGYADVGATFTAVSANWTVPTITCSGGATQYSAHWIGIDGYTSSTVEQDGTEADCISGQASYDAWFELYGDNSVDNGDEVELSPSTNPVSPTDAISASVTVSGTTWTFTIDDTSTKHASWDYSNNVVFSGGAKSSAEWVVERPEVCGRSCSLTSLADFGTVTFSSAAATSNNVSGSISAYSNAAIDMVNGSTLLAEPSALTSNGAGFVDTWKAA